MLRTETYFDWAVTNGADTFLDPPVPPKTAGAIADPGAAPNLYSTELSVISRARAQKGSVVFQAERIRRIGLVAVPDALQTAARQQQLKPEPYAFVGDAIGPGSLGIKGADGQEQVLYSTPAGQVQQLMVWGEFKEDPDLGPIWYEEGLYSCADPQVTSTCARALG